ncbi:hypothetical protein [Oscillibacter sp.]|uniref:hypothetical protein n=1 Tax=Oscillibacter sp. TaxID=1945593 RepID=UPI0028B077BD|nr:hypothetical protein [Oscillibacter sp.]
MNLRTTALFFAAGVIWLVVASQNGFQTLYLVASGLSFLAAAIALFRDFKIRHANKKSE